MKFKTIISIGLLCGISFTVGYLYFARYKVVPHAITAKLNEKVPMQAITAKLNEEIIFQLIVTLSDGDSGVKKAAIRALGKMKGAEKIALPHLIKLISGKEIETTFEPTKREGILEHVSVHFGDESIREAAIEVLGKMKGEEKVVVPHLVKILLSSDSNVVTAAESLGKMGGEAKEAVPALVQIILSSGDYNEKEKNSAAHALGEMGNAAEEAVPLLVKALSDNKRSVRTEAVFALGELGGLAEKAVPHLIKILSQEYTYDSPSYLRTTRFVEEDWLIKASAAYALKKISGSVKVAIPQLIKALSDSEGIRRANSEIAERFIGHSRWKRAYSAYILGMVGEITKMEVPELTKFLHDEDWLVRVFVAHALKRASETIRESIPIPPRIVLSNSETYDISRRNLDILKSGGLYKRNNFLFAQALSLGFCPEFDRSMSYERAFDKCGMKIERLGRIFPKVSELIQDLSNNEPSYNSFNTLEEMGGEAKEAVPYLIPLFSKFFEGCLASHCGLDRKIVRTLGRIGREAKEVIPQLIEALSDKSPYVRLGVAQVLVDIGASEERVILVLVKILSDSDLYLRHKVLLDSDWYLRSSAVDTLGEIDGGAKEAFPYLIKLLSDNDDRVRRAAIKVLGRMKGAEKVVVPHLVKILLSSDSSEAVAAAISLGKMGWRAKEAIPQLIQALSDSDRLVREYAAAALGEIGEDVYIINEKN